MGDLLFGLKAYRKPEYKITKPIRLIELFGGVGSQSMAMRNIGANYESYRLVEFDEKAKNSFNAIHGTNFPALDIRDIHASDLGIVEKDKYEYIMFYSFPCQALSLAGKRKGMKRDSGTTSSLLWEVERLIDECEENNCLPQILIMENVSQIHNDKNRDDFNTWINYLKDKGYSNFYKDLNAKDFNLGQNRVRCFMVSIFGNWDFKFPNKIPLTKTIDDYLEKGPIPEKYYLNQEVTDKMVKNLKTRGYL